MSKDGQIPPQVRCNPILEYAWKQIYWRHSNQIWMVVGLPGQGKTTIAESIMWDFDRDSYNRPRAELDNFVHTKEFFSKAVDRNVNNVGRCITWEEPSIGGVAEGGANSRQFMSQNNLQVSALFQVMRRNRHLILLTLPFSSAFDFQARAVCHGIIYVIDRDAQGTIASFYKLEPNPVFNNVYKKKMIFVADGIFQKLDHIRFGMPPAKWHEACTEKSDWYKTGWMKEISNKKKTDDSMGRNELYRKFKLGIALIKKNPKMTPYQLEARTGLRRSIWQTATSV